MIFQHHRHEEEEDDATIVRHLKAVLAHAMLVSFCCAISASADGHGLRGIASCRSMELSGRDFALTGDCVFATPLMGMLMSIPPEILAFIGIPVGTGKCCTYAVPIAPRGSPDKDWLPPGIPIG